jgi:hypothetical protein
MQSPMGKTEKVNALAGVAAISAVVAMVLTLSYLSVIMALASAIASQIPTSIESVDDLVSKLVQLRVQPPGVIEAIALLGVVGFIAVSISATVALSKALKPPLLFRTV